MQCGDGSTVPNGVASRSRAVSILGKTRWLLFVAILLGFGAGPMMTSLEDAERNYGEVSTSDWVHTNYWLKSAACARETGAWLVLCADDGKLKPISEEAIGDDPGHAFLLAMWTIINGDNDASLVDVAGLNIALNSLGFLLLASFLFAIRAYPCFLLFMYMGPIVYLKWIGVAPHWALLGVASMAAVLPMAILAKEYDFLSARLGQWFVGLGLLGLASAALVREAIALMGIVTTFCVIGFIALRRRRAGRGMRDLVVVAVLIVAASSVPYATIAARDVMFDVEPGQLVERHGFSDILYMGLGSVPNSFGITYSDWVALAAARQVDPDVVHCSPDFYRIMWGLYLDKLLTDPAEVARIYIEKARLLLSDPVLEPGPPLGIILLVGLCHFLVAKTFNLWSKVGFPQGSLVEGAALVFIGLFVAQGILASPDRGYAMPVGAAIVTLIGVLAGFHLRAAYVAAKRYFARTHP
jgi:hypothetical protein